MRALTPVSSWIIMAEEGSSGMPEFIEKLIELSPGGFPAGRIAAGILVILLSLIVARIARAILLRMSRKLHGIPSALASRIHHPLGFLVVSLGTYLAVRVLPVSEGFLSALDKVLLVGMTGGMTWLLVCSADCVAERLARAARESESKFDDQMLPILRNTARVVIVVLGAVFLLQALGYPISGIVAGLGIGGLAVALAAQDTLGGIFASIAIFLEKPFVVGDYVEVLGVQGTISDVGLRSTRITTVDRTMVSVPNRKIVENVIDNWARRNARRTVLSFGLEYGTPQESIEDLLGHLRMVFGADPEIEKDTWSVHFRGFGESSLDIEMILYLQTTDYRQWLSMRERVALLVMREIETRGLSFAFPTRTVHISR
jgi:MscS family membrane protein